MRQETSKKPAAGAKQDPLSESNFAEALDVLRDVERQLKKAAPTDYVGFRNAERALRLFDQGFEAHKDGKRVDANSLFALAGHAVSGFREYLKSGQTPEGPEARMSVLGNLGEYAQSLPAAMTQVLDGDIPGARLHIARFVKDVLQEFGDERKTK